MLESFSFPDGTTALPEHYKSGIIVVTPLSAENREKADIITSEMNGRLGLELWTPHQDITHGRILERNTALTEADFDHRLALATAALERAAMPRPSIDATLDTIEASAVAVAARASGDVEPIAALRRSFLQTLESVPETQPSVKRLNFVHTTLGRVGLGGEGIPTEDVIRVAREVADVRAQLPMVQPIDRLVIAEEPERYVLKPREEIILRHN